MGKIELRLAEINDVPLIWENIQVSFEGPHSKYVPTGQTGFQFYLKDFIETGMNEEKKLFVALLDGEVAGFADVSLSDMKNNFLTRIGTFPRFRGDGIASRLMRMITQEHSSTNRWELDVLADNHRAQKMYESKGFEVVKTKKWIGKKLSSPIFSPYPSSFDPQYSHYGFTNTVINGEHVSIAGKALRCTTVEQFVDQDFIKNVHLRFPALNEAFIILDNDNSDLDNSNETFIITRSYRMIGDF